MIRKQLKYVTQISNAWILRLMCHHPLWIFTSSKLICHCFISFVYSSIFMNLPHPSSNSIPVLTSHLQITTFVHRSNLESCNSALFNRWKLRFNCCLFILFTSTCCWGTYSVKSPFLRASVDVYLYCVTGLWFIKLSFHR